jgi:glutaredoxin
MVKDWLREHGCDFEERVITSDVEALREWRRISGGAGVPVTAFGEDVVIGFDPERLEQFVRSCRNSSPVEVPADAPAER